MTEYISRDTAIARLTRLEVTDKLATMADAKREIADMPAADVAPVVRCKDCKHSYVIIDARCCSRGAFYDVAVPDDFFCALAERKDGDSECLKSVQYGQSCRSRAKSVNATAANGTASAIKNAPAAVEIGI